MITTNMRETGCAARLMDLGWKSAKKANMKVIIARGRNMGGAN